MSSRGWTIRQPLAIAAFTAGLVVSTRMPGEPPVPQVISMDPYGAPPENYHAALAPNDCIHGSLQGVEVNVAMTAGQSRIIEPV